ncbi:hypothetical protein M422DRAFT_778953 [Sphaerobolus stellatus SS14]|uniref:Ubiquitin-like protease family profile domain-containing protein n=1 Tax=Sphaerobolus stellatus (strain SS14) TaxID=990650 RepID=A0A0C9W2X6_SPHS4|nr:hypothetical protein M422DRAFT_778953 [Sphaerobolus stellatus SS14]
MSSSDVVWVTLYCHLLSALRTDYAYWTRISNISDDDEETPWPNPDTTTTDVTFRCETRLSINLSHQKRLLTVGKADMARMAGKKWWNDVVMEFGLAMWMERFLGSGLRHTALYLFSSCFHENYNLSGFEAIRKWTRKISIFPSDVILIPVNLNLHWFVVVVCDAGQLLLRSTGRPCSILVMDSLRIDRTNIRTQVHDWLVEEIVTRNLGPCRMDVMSLDLPASCQPNYYDCGPYTVHNIDRFVRNRDQILSCLHGFINALATPAVKSANMAGGRPRKYHTAAERHEQQLNQKRDYYWRNQKLEARKARGRMRRLRSVEEAVTEPTPEELPLLQPILPSIDVQVFSVACSSIIFDIPRSHGAIPQALESIWIVPLLHQISWDTIAPIMAARLDLLRRGLRAAQELKRMDCDRYLGRGYSPRISTKEAAVTVRLKDIVAKLGLWCDFEESIKIWCNGIGLEEYLADFAKGVFGVYAQDL